MRSTSKFEREPHHTSEQHDPPPSSRYHRLSSPHRSPLLVVTHTFTNTPPQDRYHEVHDPHHDGVMAPTPRAVVHHQPSVTRPADTNTGYTGQRHLCYIFAAVKGAEHLLLSDQINLRAAAWAVTQATQSLYKISKNQLPVSLFAIIIKNEARTCSGRWQ